MTVYVAHKGDSVVAIGALEEVAETLGVKAVTVRVWASPSYQAKFGRHASGSRMVVDRVEVAE